MPLPAKLKAPPSDKVDLVKLRKDLEEYGSKCDLANCTAGAITFYRTDWSYIWICEPHKAYVDTLRGSEKLKFDKALGEYMYSFQLVWNC